MILTGILWNTRHRRETFYLILYHDADFKSHLTLMPADCSVMRTKTSLFRGRMEFTIKETDKRLEANRLVKLRIARALTKLMEKKNFSDITVTEIVQTAGVARASYYRNFTSKEEVLIKVTDEIWQNYREKAAKLSYDFFGYDSILLVFRYFKTYKHFILCVYKAGLAYIYLDIFDRQLEEQIGDMPYNDVGRYKIYFYSGALYNVFLKWLEGGMQETPAAMAQMVRSLIL